MGDTVWCSLGGAAVATILDHGEADLLVGALTVEQMDVAAFGDRARLVPIKAASTVEEMPRAIIREANACRME